MADKIEQVIVVDVEAQKAKSSLKELQTNVKGYKNELLNLDMGSKEYNETLKKLADSQGHINAVNTDARAVTMNLTDVYSQLTRVAAGVAAGFGAVSAASALLGEDNENLAKTLVRVQAGLALTQQLTTLSSGIKAANLAFKALNVTLAANPFLAVAAGISVAVSGLIAVYNSSQDAAAGINELNASYERQNREIQRINDQRELELRLMAARGDKQTEIIKKEDEYTKEYINNAESRIKAWQREIRELNQGFTFLGSWQRKRTKQLQQFIKDEYQLIREATDRRHKLTGDYLVAEAKQQTDDDKKKKETAKKNNEQELKARKEFSKSLIEIERNANSQIGALYEGQKRLNFVREEIKLNKELQETLLASINDESKTWVERNKLLSDYQRVVTQGNNLLREENTLLKERKKNADDLYKKNLENTNNVNKLIKETTKLEKEQNEQRELFGLTERQRDEIQLQRLEKEFQTNQQRLIELENDLSQEGIRNEMRIKLLEQYNEALGNQLNYEEQIYNTKKKLSEEDLQVKLSNYNATSDFLSASSSLLGENTAAGKALGVASATISTYTGAAQVLANPTELNPFAKWAQFAATIALGFTAVKNILATDVPGASSTASSPNTTIPLPSFPDTESDMIYSRPVFDAYDEDIFNQQPVLVVEDVNNVQNRVRVAEIEATF